MAPAGRCLAGHDMADAGRRGCPACRRDRVVDLAAAADRSLPQAAVAAAVDAVVPGGAVILHQLFRLERVRDDQQFARILSLEYALRHFDARVQIDI